MNQFGCKEREASKAEAGSSLVAEVPTNAADGDEVGKCNIYPLSLVALLLYLRMDILILTSLWDDTNDP